MNIITRDSGEGAPGEGSPAPPCHEMTVIPLEPMQIAEIRSLLRRAYNEGLPIFGEIRRDTTGCYLIAGIVPRERARKIQKLLAGAG